MILLNQPELRSIVRYSDWSNCKPLHCNTLGALNSSSAFVFGIETEDTFGNCFFFLLVKALNLLCYTYISFYYLSMKVILYSIKEGERGKADWCIKATIPNSKQSASKVLGSILYLCCKDVQLPMPLLIRPFWLFASKLMCAYSCVVQFWKWGTLPWLIS